MAIFVAPYDDFKRADIYFQALLPSGELREGIWSIV